jgi:uncharacterized protein YdeI (YjbR/CyaY-like superfamily)
MPSDRSRSFETPRELEVWLETHHTRESELWVRIFKKGSGTASVTWNDCVIAAIAWGWIDGQKRSLDEDSFLQRLTPRRPRSNWSQKNCQHAEQLIAEGKMQAPGLAHVEAARADGRWERAYAGQAGMVMPEEFLKALKKNAAAKEAFSKLPRSQLFAIYHSLITVKREETRQRKIASLVSELAKTKPERA